jgi:PAS domain S-box-containing protein
MEKIKPLSINELYKQVYSDKMAVLSQLTIAVVFIVDYFFLKTLRYDLGILQVIASFLSFVAIFLERVNIIKINKVALIQACFVFLYVVGIVFTIPFYSEYNILNYIVVYTSIYWFGRKGFYSTVSAITIATALAVFYQFSLDPPISVVSSALVRIVMLIATGLLVLSLNSKIEAERNQLIDINNTALLEQERLTSLINNMTDSVMSVTPEGIISLYNGATLDILDTNDSLLGKEFNKAVVLYDEENNKINILPDIKSKQHIIKRDDLSLKSKSSGNTSLFVSISSISTLDNVNQGYIVVLRDITKQKSLEEERDEFISVTSHELRTPIAIVEAGLSTVLLDNISKGMSETAKNLVTQAHKDTLFLAGLVNDLTTLARAEKNKLVVDLSEIDPAEIVKQLKVEYTPKAQERGLKLKIDIQKDLPNIFTSELYLKEILQNLITNSIKYTEKGSITVGVEKKAKNIVFWVKDTGIGISNSDRKKLFKKFFRSEDYRTRKTSGTGLGLYITQKLADMIDVKINVESKINIGSKFSIILAPQKNHIHSKEEQEKIVKSAQISEVF